MFDRDELKARIPGWGADLKPENRPGVPKEKAPPSGTGAHWREPERQPETVRVFHTIERPGLTPVFGTTCPPHGVSGKLRALAYRYSEARLAHWLPLIMADRIDVVESAASELARGRPPHPIREMGLRSDSRRLVRGAGLLGLGVAALVGVGALAVRRRGVDVLGGGAYEEAA